MANDYKNTMNLPQTAFPMRAGLPVNEPIRLQKWEQMDLYHKVLEHNAGQTPYVLHDGPPYANGPIHIGHAFNKVLKDIIVKYKSQRGFYSPYIPGWDCHGQPIEHMVETKLGPEKMAKIDQPTLRRLCREWASEHIDLQREGFKRLGITGDWEQPYLTYTPEYEAGNVVLFKALYEKGAIYRGRKPIHWCRHCHTALAEAEIEYGDESSPSIYVALSFAEKVGPFVDAAAPPAPGTDTPISLLIWTTTPWTLPANTAVALAPDADYVAVLHDGIALVMAAELVAQVGAAAGWDAPDFLRSPDGEVLVVKGSALVGLHYAHPIHSDMTGVVVTGEHVTLDTGTGAVHTAPGHGQDDYLVGEKYGLPTLMPVDDNGVFDAGGGPFEGLDVDAANPVIIDWLRERGKLVARVDIVHSYPHCWRCHKPVIFRATDQWFVSMDATGLREQALKELDTLNWYPDWAINRLRSMVEGRPDWCISRQRSWGVPIPIFKCAKCSQTVATPQTFDAVIELFRHEGADAWFTKAPADYLPTDTVCPHCGSHELVPEKDILDVWWESGVSHTSVLESRPETSRPADLYLEGSDQHRGWFQSSLLTSVGAYGVAPYRGIMSCGFTVDGEGRKMSKSLGNGIDPADVIASSGADVLRLWVGSVDSSQDVGISDEILQRSSDAYRRIRNTFRFLLSNLYDFDFRTDLVSWDELCGLDRWALVRLQELMTTVTEAYDAFKFHNAYHAIYDYVVCDLSAVYLDALKDRLYSDAPKSVARRSAQVVLLHILEVMVRQLAPILTFTCDEVWDNYPDGLRGEDQAEAVQLAGWPGDADFSPAIPGGEAQAILADYAVVLSVRDAVTKQLEEARGSKVIGKSQEAHLTISAPRAVIAVLEAQGAATLEELFIVARVDLLADDALVEPLVSVGKADGEKCPRCWNIRDLGSSAGHPDVCARCAAVLEEAGL
ncbi:MAG: isoleucine--tRNA ligase [Coriobacteriales bacterium]|nr:isoleucine--tRNA ligase [Coriobacteriales bacterium]